MTFLSAEGIEIDLAKKNVSNLFQMNQKKSYLRLQIYKFSSFQKVSDRFDISARFKTHDNLRQPRFVLHSGEKQEHDGKCFSIREHFWTLKTNY